MLVYFLAFLCLSGWGSRPEIMPAVTEKEQRRREVLHDVIEKDQSRPDVMHD